MFANELVLYINYLEQLINDQKIEGSALRKFVKNLEEGMEYLLKVAGEKAYPRENLASIRRIVMQQKQRLITLLEPNTAMAV
jgi:signal recognition particle subunit SEC65